MATDAPQSYPPFACYPLIFFLCILPVILVFVALAGVVLVPALVVGCLGVCCVLLCPGNTSTEDYIYTEESTPKRLSRQEIQEKLLVVPTQETGSCEICLQDFSTTDSSSSLSASPNPTCQHVFHTDCILDWLESKTKHAQPLTCPCCRANYVLVDENDIEEAPEDIEAPPPTNTDNVEAQQPGTSNDVSSNEQGRNNVEATNDNDATNGSSDETNSAEVPRQQDAEPDHENHVKADENDVEANVLQESSLQDGVVESSDA